MNGGRSATSAAARGRLRARLRRLSRTSSPWTDRARCCRPRAGALRDLASVEVRRGELEALPIADEELDAATLLLVLHHLPEPALALSEASRVLKPGGRLLIADMLPHDREEYRQQMGHVWLGFSEDHIKRLLAGAGFDRVRIVALPVNAAAKGPALFVATAMKSPAASG